MTSCRRRNRCSPSPRRASVPRILDRHGTPLNVTLENDWNVHDIVLLHEIPRFLKRAFIHAEDKRFHRHGGPDWIARAAALRTNLATGRTVRGGSTITEQVVRMLHPRPRTPWARWLEGFEAARLQAAFTKDEILELYLNQVPYAANRRGVRQAADYYLLPGPRHAEPQGDAGAGRSGALAEPSRSVPLRRGR